MLNVILHWNFAGSAILIVIGMLILIGGGEMLIRGASQFAVALKIPAVVVGLTIVAFGTSAPELAVSLSAALQGSADLAVGNVVGSNICNIGLILGVAALLCPVAVSSSVIRREIPLMIVLAILTLFLAVLGTTMPMSLVLTGQFEGRILPWMGGGLVALLIAYVGWTIYEPRCRKEHNKVYAREMVESIPPIAEKPDQKTSGWKAMLVNLLMIILGIALLVVGSDLMVQGSVHIARLLGVSELFIGLTILAVGTSLPELMVTVMAAIRGNSDIAVGNVIGSNIFNILGVLGVTALFSGGTASGGLLVSAMALKFDIPVMVVLSLFCLVICMTGRRVTRGEGVFLLLCYGAYLTALCMMAGN